MTLEDGQIPLDLWHAQFIFMIRASWTTLIISLESSESLEPGENEAPYNSHDEVFSEDGFI